MSDVVQHFTVSVEQVDGFEFRVRFDNPQHTDLRMDEPPPLGHDVAPNAARVLAAAVGNCLAASLVFCASRRHARLVSVRAEITVQLVRNAERRLRVGRLDVVLHVPGADPAVLAACVPAFEDFCVVTQSVRAGIEVGVTVAPD